MHLLGTLNSSWPGRTLTPLNGGQKPFPLPTPISRRQRSGKSGLRERQHLAAVAVEKGASTQPVSLSGAGPGLSAADIYGIPREEWLQLQVGEGQRK